MKVRLRNSTNIDLIVLILFETLKENKLNWLFLDTLLSHLFTKAFLDSLYLENIFAFGIDCLYPWCIYSAQNFLPLGKFADIVSYLILEIHVIPNGFFHPKYLSTCIENFLCALFWDWCFKNQYFCISSLNFKMCLRLSLQEHYVQNNICGIYSAWST